MLVLKCVLPCPPSPPPAQHDLLARRVQIGQQRFLVVGQDLRADRHAYVHVVRAGAGAVRSGTVAALARPEVLRVAKVDQRVQVGHRLEHDIAAASAGAPVRTAELDEALAPEGDHTVSAIAGADIDLGLIEELHIDCRMSAVGHRVLPRRPTRQLLGRDGQLLNGDIDPVIGAGLKLHAALDDCENRVILA